MSMSISVKEVKGLIKEELKGKTPQVNDDVMLKDDYMEEPYQSYIKGIEGDEAFVDEDWQVAVKLNDLTWNDDWDAWTEPAVTAQLKQREEQAAKLTKKDKRILNFLSNVSTTGVALHSVKNLAIKRLKAGIRFEHIPMRLVGFMSNDEIKSGTGLDAEKLAEWMTSNGAQKMKTRRRPKSRAYDMYD